MRRRVQLLSLVTALALLAMSACDSGEDSQRQGAPGETGGADAVAELPTDSSSGDGSDLPGDGLDGANGDSTELDPDKVWVDEDAELIWQRVAAETRMTVEAALLYCEENKGELPGLGWRLPNVTELRSLVRGCPATETDGVCGLTESCTAFESCWSTDCWSTCMLGDGPGGCYRETALEGSCSAAWSMDGVDDQPGRYWYLNYRRAGLHHDIAEVESEVRCVRWLQ